MTEKADKQQRIQMRAEQKSFMDELLRKSDGQKMSDDPIGKKLFDLLMANENLYTFDIIEKAFFVAKFAHEGQLRKSGDPYVTHPLETACILMSYGMDTDSIVAALLHDVVEDTMVHTAEVKSVFGEEIADLVDGVTKLGKIPYSSKEEEQVENLRKMFLATAKDIRVVIIKLADRLHNMRTMEAMPDHKRREKSLETMEIYAPLAHRMGMQRLKTELEDLALRFLDPIGYNEIERDFAEQSVERNQFLNDVISKLSERVKTDFPQASVEGRIKHIYSVYNKMYKQDKKLTEIYDLYAVRVIVDSIIDCYNVFGIIHDMWKPIPGKFKDYISTPKPNMYQSLHTTVIGSEGMPFEVQIRTWDMHRVAELGIAAHWKYKRGLSKKDGLEDKLAWVRQILEIQNSTTDPEEFLRTFKIDFFDDEVFVFTPKGDLKNMASGATVIDFAYSIHSEVGNKMIGAKVNGKIVPFEYVVQNGDIIEVLTIKEGKGPSRDWLNIAVTTEAKSKIKQWFKRERREENIERGKEEIARNLKQNLINLTTDELESMILPIANRVGIANVDDLYAAVGYGGMAINRIMTKLKDEYSKLNKPTNEEVLKSILQAPVKTSNKKQKTEVVVEGLEGCLIKYARCCNPLPGDSIVGYVTKGYGVSVHRSDCVNFLNSVEKEIDTQRWVKVSWGDAGKSHYQTELSITATNRKGFLAELTTSLANMKIDIHTISAREDGDGLYTLVQVGIEVTDMEHLRTIINKLNKIKGVVDIKRGREQ